MNTLRLEFEASKSKYNNAELLFETSNKKYIEWLEQKIIKECNTPVVNTSFYYYNVTGKYCICDLEFCSKSERTFDVHLFDIANNERLLNIFHLHYMHGTFGVSYNYTSRAKWFCGYLSSFKRGIDGTLQYKKSLTNPIVRILIEDTSILGNVLNCFDASQINEFYGKY
jgi:hypothetical protein